MGPTGTRQTQDSHHQEYREKARLLLRQSPQLPESCLQWRGGRRPLDAVTERLWWVKSVLDKPELHLRRQTHGQVEAKWAESSFFTECQARPLGRHGPPLEAVLWAQVTTVPVYTCIRTNTSPISGPERSSRPLWPAARTTSPDESHLWGPPRRQKVKSTFFWGRGRVTTRTYTCLTTNTVTCPLPKVMKCHTAGLTHPGHNRKSKDRKATEFGPLVWSGRVHMFRFYMF